MRTDRVVIYYRARILQVLAKKLKLEGNFDFVHIAKKTPGFVGADLTALTKEAASICINRVFSQLEATEVNPNSMEVDTPEKTQTNGSDQIQPFVSAQQKMRLESERELGQRSMASDVLRARIEPFTEDQLRPLAITMNDFELVRKNFGPNFQIWKVTLPCISFLGNQESPTICKERRICNNSKCHVERCWSPRQN
jgi:ribosome biogenesis ATPase